MPPIKEVSSTVKTGDTAARAQAQAVALEVPVTVNGARAVEGSDKREPFSETTTTVLVMGHGAVIRLSAQVAPGQLLFLTNTKTRKEVVCQVVKSKSYRNVSGYVELEFTEPVMGFWGMRFPADRAGAQPIASAPAAAPTVPLVPKMSAAAPREENPSAIETKSVPASQSPRPAPPSTPAPEFALTESLKSQAARLQDQLSSMSFEPAASKPATPTRTERKSPEVQGASVAGAKSEPARAKEVRIPEIKSTLEVEELKIPSWLEPLARNAAAPAPVVPAEVGIPEEAPSASLKPTHQPEHREVALPTPDADRATASAARIAAAALSNRLLNADADLPAAKASRRGHQATFIAAIAAVTVLAASAYWYMQPKSRAAVSPSPTSMENNSEISRPGAPKAPETVNGNVVPEAAVPRERRPNALSTAAASNTAAKANGQETSLLAGQPAESPSPAVKKPSLGEVRLATPTVNKPVGDSAAQAPHLDLGGQALPSGDGLGNSLVSGSSKPVAPPALPLGGDVKPARLSVSVAPVYPTIARSQRISGDVRVDALIDVNGRVSAMKVISGPALLHQAAMDALRQWKYAPATLDGKPVPMHLTVTLQFRLQ